MATELGTDGQSQGTSPVSLMDPQSSEWSARQQGTTPPQTVALCQHPCHLTTGSSPHSLLQAPRASGNGTGTQCLLLPLPTGEGPRLKSTAPVPSCPLLVSGDRSSLSQAKGHGFSLRTKCFSQDTKQAGRRLSSPLPLTQPAHPSWFPSEQ